MKNLIIGLMAILTACTGRASVEANTADDAETEKDEVIASKDRQIKKLTKKVRTLTEVVKQNVPDANAEAPAPASNGPELLTQADTPVNRTPTPGVQLLAYRPAGPECGQAGPSVGYVDHDPVPDAMCAGNCIMVRNTTPHWMSIRTPGGERMLICGGWGAYQGTAQVPETHSFEPISAAPGSARGARTAVTWLNHSGQATFILEFWRAELDGTLVRTKSHTFTTTFPYRNSKWGMNCNDFSC